MALSLLFCLLSVASAQYTTFEQEQQQQYFQPQGFDQSLSYSGGSGSGSGSVPSVPTYGGGSPSSGSGSVPSVPSYGGGSGGGTPSSGSGSVPSGSGSVPSGSGSVPSYGGDGPGSGSGSGSVPSGGYGGVPSGGSGSSPSGGIPGIGGPGGIPSGPSTGGSPTSGCSCDFWAAHVNSWPDPMQIISTVSAIFGGLASNTFGPSTTLLTALRNTRPDPYSQLLRQGTAAMLNSYATPHYFYSPQDVRTQFNAALVSPHAAAVQAAKFANANRGYGRHAATFCT